MTLDQAQTDVLETRGCVRSDLENEIIYPFKEKVSELLGCCQVMSERLDKYTGSPNYQQKIEKLENENLALRVRCSELEDTVKELHQKSFLGLSEFEQRQIDDQLLKNRLTSEMLHTQNQQLQDKLDLTERQLVEAKGQVELLSVQLMIYKEDFESERNDRERVQGRIVDLEQQLKHLMMQQQQMQLPYKVTVPATATFNFRQPQLSPPVHNYNSHHHHHRFNELTARGYDQCDYEIDGACTETNDGEVVDSNCESIVQVEGQHPGTAWGSNDISTQQSTDNLETDGFPDVDPLNSIRLSGSELQRNSSILHCTKCHKPFFLEDHMLLLDHLEECQD